MMARTPRFVAMIGLVIKAVDARLSINTFFRVNARCNPLFAVDAWTDVVMVVVMLHDFRRSHFSLDDAGRCLSFNFATFKIFSFAISRAVKVRSKRRRGDQ